MNPITSNLVKYGIVTLFLAGISGCNQSPTSEEFAELKKNQETMQKDLEELKKWVEDRTPKPPKPFEPSPVSISGVPFVGKSDAPVTLVEFTDYQCPFCKRHATTTLPQIVKDYVDTGKVKYVLRDFPLKQIHSNAVKLSEAVLCANDQGKGWEMHSQIFSAGKSLDPNKLSKEIKVDGLDATIFDTCLKSDQYAGKIEESLKEGKGLGVTGTPAFFMGKTDINDPGKIVATVKVVGAQSFVRFKAEIDKILNEKEPAPKEK